MNSKIKIIILITLFVFSCNRKINNGNDVFHFENLINNEENNINQSENISITADELAARNAIARDSRIATEEAQAALGFPKLMYVTNRAGINEYSETSINSNELGTLKYGEMIQVFVKSDKIDTVNGISDYWYRTRFYDHDNRWIFGGYLSEELPDDFPTIMGLWDVIGDEKRYFRFNLDYRYSEGYKGTGIGLFGVWILNENMVTIEIRRYSDLFIDVYEVIMTFDIKYNIIDRNNIELKLPLDVYTEENIVLTRNKSGTW